MTGGRFILVGGGARSGKTAFALGRARALGARRAFIATAQAFDDEMRERIDAHRRERGEDFVTIEEPFALAAALAGLDDIDVVVIDCLTIWLTNLLLRDDPPARILAQVDELAEAACRRAFHAIVVTNEVGLGVVPATPLGRSFRDLAGLAHQRLARRADEIDLAILGTVLRIKPMPIRACDEGASDDR